jgi:hypothetical protein
MIEIAEPVESPRKTVSLARRLPISDRDGEVVVVAASATASLVFSQRHGVLLLGSGVVWSSEDDTNANGSDSVTPPSRLGRATQSARIRRADPGGPKGVT